MKSLAIVGICMILPVLALAGDGPADRTCDTCVDVEGTLYPTPAWQYVQGSTVGETNSEYAYYFCAEAGATYEFTTCEDYAPAGSDYDTALSIWSIGGGGACDANMACNDDNCASPNFLHSFVSFVAPSSGDYIVVVDGFSSATGTYTLGYAGVECAVPVVPSTWGQIKATYE